MLESAARRAQKPVEPPVPKPEPLAIIPSGLPIAEVTQRLLELQEEYPDAEVRRRAGESVGVVAEGIAVTSTRVS
jgi:hypothetical protein